MNIYIGNIPYSTTEEDLEKLFSEYGAVNAVKIITHKHTGRSKGFGFVEMAMNEDGQRAVENLNGHELNGRSLRVDQAKDREAAPEREA